MKWEIDHSTCNCGEGEAGPYKHVEGCPVRVAREEAAAEMQREWEERELAECLPGESIEQKRYRKRQEKRDECELIEACVPGLLFERRGEGEDWSPGYGGMVPWQAEGTYCGKPFYARFRSNTASISLWNERDENGETPFLDTDWSGVVYDYIPGDTYAGALEGPEEIVEFFERVIPTIAQTSEENPNSSQRLAAAVEAMMSRLDSGELKFVDEPKADS